MARTPRPPAVAGVFYAADPAALRADVDECVAAAAGSFPPGSAPGLLVGVLVPHAGLVYSGAVAAAAWRLLGADAATMATPGTNADARAAVGAVGAGPPTAAGEHAEAFTPTHPAEAPTIVLLGTNHGAGWLTGVGAWVDGPWRTPLGDAEIDRDLLGAIVGLAAPFVADSRCHLGEHSIEVQLPFVRRLAPGARIVALSVGAGTGRRAIEAGERLGVLLAARHAAGAPIVLAISTDMAHYPPARVAERVTEALLPHIVALDPEGLATAEAGSWDAGPGVSCGMCGIDPSVLGLAALRAMGARPGTTLAAATSADAGGDPRRTVGYLAVAFEAG